MGSRVPNLNLILVQGYVLLCYMFLAVQISLCELLSRYAGIPIQNSHLVLLRLNLID